MDAPTATVITALIGAFASIAVALITTRAKTESWSDLKPGNPSRTQSIDERQSLETPLPGIATNRRHRTLSMFFLWLLYFVTGFYIISGLGLLVTQKNIDNAIANLIFGLSFLMISVILRKRLQKRWAPPQLN